MGGERDPGAIVVAGPAACGKTTFATALARRLGFALFDLDQVTGSLSAAALSLLGRAEHAFDEGGPGKELREARYASLVDTARANVSIGWGVVLAAPFTSELADPVAWRNLVGRLAAAAPSSGARLPAVALVYLDCPAPVILERPPATASSWKARKPRSTWALPLNPRCRTSRWTARFRPWRRSRLPSLV